MKTGSAWGWTSAGSFVLGLTFTAIGAWEYRHSESDKLSATAYVGFGLMGFSLVSLIPYAANRSAGIVKIDSAVDIYNSTAIKRQRNSDVSLNFGITQSGGIGLVLNF